ncbi:MAG: TolC family protein [Lewinellaceae bacterium]|nr:TolC family protein [Lewinellaceae bacterium]
MKYLFPILLWSVFIGKIYAQPATFRPITLSESLHLALENSAQLQKARLDRQGIDKRMQEGRSAAYPQISMGFGIDYLPVLPTQLLPGQLFGMADNTFLPVQFGQPWQLTGSIQLQQQLFNESMRRAAPAANVTRNIYDLLITRSEEEVVFTTATVFYQTLQTEQLLRAMNANLDKLDALQRMAELQLANGYAIPTDVKRIKVARTNLETQRQNLYTAISGLRQTLQFLCGVPFEEAFDPMEEMSAPAADSARWQVLALEPENTTEFRLLLHQVELNRIQLSSLRAENLPNFSAHANAFTQTFRPDANFFDLDRRWYGAVAFGLKMHIPIFDGFRRLHKSSFLAIEGQKLAEDRRQLNSAKGLEFRQAREQLQNALRSLRTQTDNVGLAREISDKLMLQYREGVVPLTDLLNAQTALSEAETNYWQQVFTYKLAVLKLLKTTGKLEELKEK